jgi:hypothetical protein
MEAIWSHLGLGPTLKRNEMMVPDTLSESLTRRKIWFGGFNCISDFADGPAGLVITGALDIMALSPGRSHGSLDFMYYFVPSRVPNGDSETHQAPECGMKWHVMMPSEEAVDQNKFRQEGLRHVHINPTSITCRFDL